MRTSLRLATAIGVGLIGAVALVRRGMRWGATADEQSMRLTGDALLDGGPPTRLAMTRAVSIAALPDAVWPWLAQLGRGAGWYSIDRLDNGGRTSARHVVSWIPAPRVGDATAIGYLHHVDPGRELVWWSPGEVNVGHRARLVADFLVTPEADGSRLVIRMSADLAGPLARPGGWLFAVVDSIMARRQVLGIKERVEAFGARTGDPDAPETGARDQYQLYEVIYADRSRAGVAGREHGAHWHHVAVADGVLSA